MDLAEAIIKRAQDIENTEDVSYLKITINMTKTCFFVITKAKRFVRITNKEKDMSYKIQSGKDLSGILKQVWRLIIIDLLQGVLRESLVINKGIGMGWGLSEKGPFGLIECTTAEIMTGTLSKSFVGIDTLVAFACLVSSPGISLEKIST